MFSTFLTHTLKQNPKSEYRNPKQTHRQTNLKSGKSKTPNPKDVCFAFCIFQPFEFVSNFVLRIWCFPVWSFEFVLDFDIRIFCS
jgi:hypothetical protein